MVAGNNKKETPYKAAGTRIMIEGLSFCIGLVSIFYYLVLISKIDNKWLATTETTIEKAYTIKNAFTIVIPARNEALKIGECLTSILNLRYDFSKIEIIVVDDHSTDETELIAKNYKGVKVISLDEISGKKSAMVAGLEKSKHPYIWFVDADCLVHPDNARLIDSRIQSDPDLDFLAGAVSIISNDNILSRFQYLDTAAMMLITNSGYAAGNYHLANGANMVVLKETFKKIGGFDGNTDKASGDDVFLVKKIVENNGKVGFLKSRRASVKTLPEESWSSFWTQRKRWAAKTKSYVNRPLLFLQGYVFCIHLLIIIYFATSSILPINLMVGLLLLILKGIVDYMFLNRAATFFDDTKPMKSFLAAFFLYFIYIFYTAYWAMLPGKYIWKGRIRS